MKSDELRLLLAIVLSTLIIIGYQVFFARGKVSGKVIHPPQRAEKSAPPPERKPSPPLPAPAKEISLPVPGPQKGKTFSDETDLVYYTFSARGGVLISWKLKKYKRDGHFLEMVPEGELKPFSVVTGDKDFDLWANTSDYSAEKTGKTLRFLLKKDEGNYIVKEFTYEKPYTLKVRVRIKKEGKDTPFLLWGPGLAPISDNPKSPMEKRQISYLKGDSVETIKKEDPTVLTSDQWVAYHNRYFTIIFFSKQAALVKINSKPFLSVSNPKKVYIGPKDYFILKKLGKKTDKIVHLGLFWFIGVPILVAMKWIYMHLIPNYGIAIILITILIKLLLYPLTHKSYVSMYKMQKLQPKIKIIQQKYKGADPEQKKKMNMELMALYKKEGVNPASGCLPLLLQLPILWAFFSLLTAAVELWQQPFFLWIKDLSAKDPYLILPILMGISQFALQIMTPSGNPSQQKITALLMSGFFTFIFASFPSGLVLYWLTYNLLSIGQQHFINKYLKALEVSHET